MYKCSNTVHLHNHSCCGKTNNYTYSEYVSLALVMQHVKHIHHIMFSHVACLALPYPSTIPHEQHDFWKNISHSKKNAARYYHKCT